MRGICKLAAPYTPIHLHYMQIQFIVPSGGQQHTKKEELWCVDHCIKLSLFGLSQMFISAFK